VSARCAWEARGRPAGAEAVLLLHSLGSDRAMWAPQIEALAASYRVLCVDLPGHGASRGTVPETLEPFARAVLAVADEAEVERFHLAGLSLGGLTALKLALLAPERVRSLAACNTAAKIGSAETWQARIDAVRAEGMAAQVDGVLARWFSPDFGARHPDWLAAARRTFCSTALDDYVACCRLLASADLRAEVGGIAVPTLVVGAERDVSTPASDAVWLRDHIRDSELMIVPEAAHLSNLDREDVFTPRLQAFLRAH